MITACCFFILVGLALPHLRGLSPNSWVHQFSLFLQLGAVFFLIALVVCIQRITGRTFAYHFIEAARNAAKEDRRFLEGWKRYAGSFETRKFAFKNLPRGSKIGYFLIVASGVFMIIYGVLDFCGVIPLYKAQTIDGKETIAVSKWITGAVEIVLGFVALIASSLIKYRQVDLWKEKLFKDLGIK